MSCDTSAGLMIFYYIKIARNIIFIVAPIIFLILGTIDFLGIVSASSEKDMSKFLDTLKKRGLILMAIMLLPAFVSLAMSFTTDTTNTSCMEKATKANIDRLIKEEDEARKKREEEEKQSLIDKIKKMNEEAEKKAEEEKKNNGGGSGSGASASGKIVSMKVNDLDCPVYYGQSVLSTLRVDSGVSSELHGILSSVCYSAYDLGLPGVLTAGAYTNKPGYHGRGIAIDLFNTWSFKKNGKTYSPYSGQGTSTWNKYKKFICEVCNGKEDCYYNLNYQIYIKYFRPKGWCWGGSWNTNYFDPMHFEKTDGGCSTTRKLQITCN